MTIIALTYALGLLLYWDGAEGGRPDAYVRAFVVARHMAGKLGVVLLPPKTIRNPAGERRQPAICLAEMYRIEA
jgi:hypothetical protein